MDTKDIIEYFDRLAPVWDDAMIRNEPVISTILDCAGIQSGIDVLDVACGTGVLFPDYLDRGVTSLAAIDISPKMAGIAQSKFPDVDVICGDVMTASFLCRFDSIVVYNAFPHFTDPEGLIRVLSTMLNPHGRLTIAHGMSREALNLHHRGRAQKVSTELMHEDQLEELMSRWLRVDIKISDNEKYIVSGQL